MSSQFNTRLLSLSFATNRISKNMANLIMMKMTMAVIIMTTARP